MARVRFWILSGLGIAMTGGGLASCTKDIKDEDLDSVKDIPITPVGADPCKPEAASCYVAGKDGPGNECMAQRDNANPTTNPNHVQLRWTWSVNVEPEGLYNNSLLNSFINPAMQFKAPECFSEKGTSGYMLVMDWNRTDPANETATIGYADAVPEGLQTNALSAGGLCMTSFNFNANGPDGGKVAPEKWFVQPTKSVRVKDDFDVKRDLAKLRELKEGEGIFYFDPVTNTTHGYSPVTYVVTNVLPADSRGLTAIKIRDAELRIRANDPDQNCAGRFRSDKLDINASCVSDDPTNPQWGCSSETETNGQCQPGQADSSVVGHFRIEDLERVTDLAGASLCAEYVGGGKAAATGGWTAGETTQYCSSLASWGTGSASDPLKRGNWCSADNSPAHDGCADSWKTVTYFALQAFPIQLDDKGEPKRCSPSSCKPGLDVQSPPLDRCNPPD